MVSTFDNLYNTIEDGMNGKNQSIPIGLPRLGRYANIRKKILTLLFSTTGAGKSAMVDTIILNACTDYMDSAVNKLKPDFQLFSMERNAELRIAKWISFIIFKNEGHVIEIPKMLGWWTDEKLTVAEKALIKSQKAYIEQILNDYVTIHEGAKTPNEIYRIMKDHFEAVGKYSKIEKPDSKTGEKREYKIYTPNNEDSVVIPVFDHGNLLKTTKELPTKKAVIDKNVEYVQGFRDLEKAAPIWVAQVNRAISGVTRQKDQEHELVLEDVKESGDVGDACDIAISLFDPVKYSQGSKTGYSPTDFIDQTNGNSYFRSAQILKSSYGADSIRIPLAFNGFCGQFKEMPKRKDLNDVQYGDLIQKVITRQYFL